MKKPIRYEKKIITGRTRLTYVNLFVPRAVEEGQEPRYSVCLLIPKGDIKTLQEIHRAVEEVKKSGIHVWGGKVPESLKMPLRDGDAEKPEQMEFAGHYYLNASSRQRPGVVDPHLKEILDSREVYSGCYGRASLNFYAYARGASNGIACSLQNVQKIAEGEPLTGRARPEEDFEVIEEELWG
jgi:hypothetical protein